METEKMTVKEMCFDVVPMNPEQDKWTVRAANARTAATFDTREEAKQYIEALTDAQCDLIFTLIVPLLEHKQQQINELQKQINELKGGNK